MQNLQCKYNKDAHNKGNYISDDSNFGEDTDEGSDYLVISDDDVDYGGDDDSDACDHLVISDATMFFSPSTRLSRSLAVIQWGPNMKIQNQSEIIFKVIEGRDQSFKLLKEIQQANYSF